MNTEMNFTNQKIKFENGNVFGIYSKITKTGIRYYRYSVRQMRFFPISQIDINKYICLEN